MSDTRYNLVFSGQVVGGADPAAVKQNLAKLFKIDAARVEALFSGKPVVLKKDADQAAAMKFRAALRQAGAQCQMVAIGEDVAAKEPVAPTSTKASFTQPEDEPTSEQNNADSVGAAGEGAEPVAESAAEKPAASADMEMVGTIRTGGGGFSGEFDVAPVGADIGDEVDAPAPFVPDVSDISLAPAGSDMGEIKKEQVIKVPDISHLSIAPESKGDNKGH